MSHDIPMTDAELARWLVDAIERDKSHDGKVVTALRMIQDVRDGERKSCAPLQRELEVVRDALKLCKRHYRCDECLHILTSRQFKEWQHTDCGGVVREYVERMPILQATQRAEHRNGGDGG